MSMAVTKTTSLQNQNENAFVTLLGKDVYDNCVEDTTILDWHKDLMLSWVPPIVTNSSTLTRLNSKKIYKHTKEDTTFLIFKVYAQGLFLQHNLKEIMVQNGNTNTVRFEDVYIANDSEVNGEDHVIVGIVFYSKKGSKIIQLAEQVMSSSGYIYKVPISEIIYDASSVVKALYEKNMTVLARASSYVFRETQVSATIQNIVVFFRTMKEFIDWEDFKQKKSIHQQIVRFQKFPNDTSAASVVKVEHKE